MPRALPLCLRSVIQPDALRLDDYRRAAWLISVDCFSRIALRASWRPFIASLWIFPPSTRAVTPMRAVVAAVGFPCVIASLAAVELYRQLSGICRTAGPELDPRRRADEPRRCRRNRCGW